jgi:hypothetical protein
MSIQYLQNLCCKGDTVLLEFSAALITPDMLEEQITARTRAPSCWKGKRKKSKIRGKKRKMNSKF